MGLVNNATLNFMVNKGGKLVESCLLKKPTVKKFEGLKCLPEVSADVVVISKGQNPYQEALTKELAAPLSMPAQIVIASTRIDLESLKTLSTKGLSLSEMAEKLNITATQTRRALERAGLTTDLQKEFRALYKYFTAASKAEKVKAFEEIDKSLKQIAKEEHKLRKGTPFEDCLQDVRLRFFEIAEKSKKSGVTVPYHTLRLVRKASPVLKSEMVTTKPLKADIASYTDTGIEMFENKDYENYLWNYIEANLRYRETEILKRRVKNEETYKEIAEVFCLTHERVRSIYKTILSKLDAQYKKEIPYDYCNPEKLQ